MTLTGKEVWKAKRCLAYLSHKGRAGLVQLRDACLEGHAKEAYLCVLVDEEPLQILLPVGSSVLLPSTGA